MLYRCFRFNSKASVILVRNLFSKRSFDKHCYELVRDVSYDHYLIGLLLQPQSRDLYFAIQAFNAEIAMIKDNTRGNSIAGRMRFQWWEDAINREFNETVVNSQSVNQKLQHPVIQALAFHLSKSPNSSKWLLRSLEARYRDFCESKFSEVRDLEDYAERGHSSFLYVMLESKPEKYKASADLQYLTSHVGVCCGIITLLRGIPFQASHSHVIIPDELINKYKIPVQTLLGKSSDTIEALEDAVYEIACQAHAHLDRAKSIFASNVLSVDDKELILPILLETVHSSMYLEELQNKQFNPFKVVLKNPRDDFPFMYNLLRTRISYKI